MTAVRRLAVAVVVFALTTTACRDSGPTDAIDADAGEKVTASGSFDPPPESEEPDNSHEPEIESVTSDQSPLTTADLSLPPARGVDELTSVEDSDPTPTSITIERLGLEKTTVLAVGIEANGDMTVPPPLEVGWYRYGPTPGQSGSAVLAGHIASNGVDGAFRHLDRLEPGDVVQIGFDDGTASSFVVDELIQVDKTELPFDTIFARSGPPKLALITCGGEFDYNARSYDDNVIAVARPLEG